MTTPASGTRAPAAAIGSPSTQTPRARPADPPAEAKRWRCLVCGEAFARPADAREHYRREHSAGGLAFGGLRDQSRDQQARSVPAASQAPENPGDAEAVAGQSQSHLTVPGETRHVCREHLTAVTWRGAGCGECAARREAYRARLTRRRAQRLTRQARRESEAQVTP